MSELAVILGDSVAGTLTRLRGGQLRFDYADDYDGGTPLSLSMPVQVRSHPNGVVAPWLWGLLPDNEAVLRRWAREFHASAASPFSMLATPVGEDCAGAVRFAKPDEFDRVLARPGAVTWLDEHGVAARLRELQEDATTWLGRTFTGQFSLAGAQAKTALLRSGERWGVPSGSTPTTHILKPAVAGLDDHDLNEHLCLDAARRAGLIAARTVVSRFDDETAVVVTRYDRVERDSSIVRVHQEDLCQALSVPPDRKYENEGGPGVERIAALLRDAMPARESERRRPPLRRRADLELVDRRHRRAREELLAAARRRSGAARAALRRRFRAAVLGPTRAPAPVCHEARRRLSRRALAQPVAARCPRSAARRRGAFCAGRRPRAASARRIRGRRSRAAGDRPCPPARRQRWRTWSQAAPGAAANC